MTKESKNKVIGIIILIVNIIWTGYWIWLFYGYHFTDKLWMFMYPDWILILNVIFGMIGISIGIRLIRGLLLIKSSLLIEIPKFIIGFLISYIIAII